jgi:SAM-dependent methyltransferase
MTAAAPGAPRIFSPEYYARLHAVEEAHWWVWGMRRIAATLLDVEGFQGTGRALDAGCGTGGTLRWLEGRYPRLALVGLDLAAEALQYAAGPGTRRVAQGSVAALPFGSATFDLVGSLDVLQHVPDGGDAAAVREAARVLRPGGLLLVRAAALRAGDFGGARAPDGYHRYSLEELTGTVVAAGLAVRRATPVNWLLSRVETWRHRGRSCAGHRGDPGLAIAPPRAAWLTAGQRLVIELEARYLSRPHRRLPGGHTLLLLAAKEGP